ncbi:MAG: hypothetical protein WBK55_06795 [Alphaproteobacteria bacterium]
MIELTAGNAPQTEVSGKILKMVHNPRMGGGVPSWVRAETAREEIAGNLARAGAPEGAPQTALSYQVQETAKTKNEEFSFYDLLDIINPLQHIPLVNTAYRKLTGDEIKSAPQIIGGAIFGGAAGAAGGLFNVIVQEETGKDIADNALGLFSGKTPQWKKHLPDNPEKRLAAALSGAPPQEELPVSLLAFTDRGLAKSIQPEKKVTEYFSPYEIY